MQFNNHPAIVGQHAFLSPSYYHWLNYTDHKLEARWASLRSAAKGTALHDLAHKAILLGVKISSADKTLSAYVRDGIGYKMSVEQPLYYSENCFGTADCISFRRNLLRVHDLKTGIVPTSEKQLEIYAALFCLEYNISPFDIDIELRIYQGGEIKTFIPYSDTIFSIMERIIEFDKRIEVFKEGGLL